MNKLIQAAAPAAAQMGSLMGPTPQAPIGAQPQPSQQQPPPQAAPQAYSPEEVAGHRATLGAIHDGLWELVNKPRGSLSKQDVYNSIADMIASGAFSTPGEKQAIVAQLAQMPDNETAIRNLLGQKFLRVAAVRDAYHGHYGAGED